MYTLSLVSALLVSAAYAQSNSSKLEVPVYGLPAQVKLVTIVAVDSTATTFKYACTDPSASGKFLTPTAAFGSAGDTATVTEKAKATKCESFTYTQGPSLWEMSFSVPNVGYKGHCTADKDGAMCSSSYSYPGGSMSGNDLNEWTKSTRKVEAEVEPTITLPKVSGTAASGGNDTASGTAAETSGFAGRMPRPTGAAYGFAMGGLGLLGAALAL